MAISENPRSDDWRPGDACSKNFKLVKKVESLDELWALLNSEKSLFARHRIYPAAFFHSWQFREVNKWLTAGWFWWVEPI